jgi:hypothetical protein
MKDPASRRAMIEHRRGQDKRDLEWALKSVVDRHPAMKPPPHVFARMPKQNRQQYERALADAQRAAYEDSTLGRLRAALEPKHDDT